MKFKNLKKFLATITLGAMSFGIVGCNPAGAIKTSEEFDELRKAGHEKFQQQAKDQNFDYQKGLYAHAITNNLSLCIMKGLTEKQISDTFRNASNSIKPRSEEEKNEVTEIVPAECSTLVKKILTTESPKSLCDILLGTEEYILFWAFAVTTFMVGLI